MPNECKREIIGTSSMLRLIRRGCGLGEDEAELKKDEDPGSKVSR